METPRDKADVFVDFSAHVNSITVCVHVGGWVENGEYERREAYLENHIDVLRLYDWLLSTLNSITVDEARSQRETEGFNRICDALATR